MFAGVARAILQPLPDSRALVRVARSGARAHMDTVAEGESPPRSGSREAGTEETRHNGHNAHHDKSTCTLRRALGMGKPGRVRRRCGRLSEARLMAQGCPQRNILPLIRMLAEC